MRVGGVRVWGEGWCGEGEGWGGEGEGEGEVW